MTWRSESRICDWQLDLQWNGNLHTAGSNTRELQQKGKIGTSVCPLKHSGSREHNLKRDYPNFLSLHVHWESSCEGGTMRTRIVLGSSLVLNQISPGFVTGSRTNRVPNTQTSWSRVANQYTKNAWALKVLQTNYLTTLPQVGHCLDSKYTLAQDVAWGLFLPYPDLNQGRIGCDTISSC